MPDSMETQPSVLPREALTTLRDDVQLADTPSCRSRRFVRLQCLFPSKTSLLNTVFFVIYLKCSHVHVDSSPHRASPSQMLS